MDFEFDDVQQALVDTVDGMLQRHAGPSRAREILTGSGYDDALEKRLGEAGLLDLARDPDAGPLAAVLVQERVTAHLGVVAMGTRSLIAPALGLDLEGPVALASRLSGQRVRFGAQARSALVLADGRAFVADVESCGTESRRFGYPIATVELSKKEELPAGAAGELARWWRIALATDIAALAHAALRLTSSHLIDRIQFGRPIASRQAVQHRLAEVYVRAEAATWAARYAATVADQHAAEEAGAVAATTAVGLAHTAIWELHQLSGAIGFTVEYDLQLFTMCMHALRLELDGVSGGHAQALADQRWFRVGVTA
jgi:alkylation response protein AidB-like acyl-CoA dehydrogenase